MRRPISILCISDLHYEKGDMSAISRLHSDYSDYVNNHDLLNKRWHPDYVVVAGDVVNFDSHDYSEPHKNIQQLIKDFGIDKSHVIIVPGNHDKYVPPCTGRKALAKNKNLFKTLDDNKDHIKRFGEAYYSRFKDYVEFCEPYFEPPVDHSCEYYSPDILDEQIKCLSGVKVFQEDSLCFLIVNTEWLYVPNNLFRVRNRKTLLEHLILYENCQLNAPIVKATCNKIINDYPHYAVVTVMHRGFEDLSWKEKNNCDPLSVDAIGYIEDVSDIIITGHDHTINTAPPTLIKNRIQHFRLGSVGRKEPVSTEHIRTASIIRFYPTGKFIEMLNLSYKKDQNGERRWFFTPDNNTYPLYSKYDRNSVSLRLFENYIPIKSQSIKKEDILKAIEKHFILHSDVTLHVVEANAETMMEELREIAKENDGVKYIVVYFIRHLFFPQNIEELTEYRIKVEEGIRTFEKENKNLFILNRLIINKVYIQIPIFYTQNKK